MPAVNGSGGKGIPGDTGAFSDPPVATPTQIRTAGNRIKALVGYLDVTINGPPGDTYYFTVGGAGGHGLLLRRDDKRWPWRL